MPLKLSRRALTTSATAATVAAALPVGHIRAQSATPQAATGSAAAGNIDSALSQLPALVQDLMDQTGVPGIAVSVVHQGETVYAAGFGEREVDTDEPVGPDTVFQIASVSKPVSSTVVSSVVGDGLVDWDSPVSLLDPRFEMSGPWLTANTTLEDLFSHRSGLPDHAGDDLEDLGGTREEVLYALRFIEPDGDFRASYAYTNFGLTAAAEAVAHALDTTWEDLGHDRLFQPAGMTRTSFRYSDFVNRDNRCVGHVERDGQWIHAFDRQPDAQAPAGGISSTVNDLAIWMRLQLGNGELDGTRLIDAAELGRTHLPHAMSSIPEPPFGTMPGFYGLGWNVSYDPGHHVTLSHSGGFAYGAATAVYLWPAEELGIVVLTNGEPIGLPESISLSFHDLYKTGEIQHDYLAILRPMLTEQLVPDYGDDVATPPSSVEPAREPDAYAGIYTNDVFGDLEIATEGDALTMTLGPEQREFPLTHYSRDVFTYEPVGENAGRTSAVTFTMAADGDASHVVVENLDLYGAGTFERL